MPLASALPASAGVGSGHIMPGAAGGGAEYHLAGGVAGGVEELEAGRAALRFFPPYIGAGRPRILFSALR